MTQFIDISPAKWSVEQVRLATYLLRTNHIHNFHVAHVCYIVVGALNAALISALTNSDGLGALNERANRVWYAYLYEGSSVVPSIDNVLSVRDLLERAVTLQLIDISEDDDEKIKRLIDDRDRLIHVRPETHLIAVERILSAVLVVVKLTADLINKFCGYRLEDSEKREFSALVDECIQSCERYL